MRIQLRRDTFNNIQANIANAAMYVSPGELFLETSNGILRTSTTHLTGNTDWNSFTTVGPKNRFTNSNSSIVGTTDTQTLTNKTFTSPSVSSYTVSSLDLSSANIITTNITSMNVVNIKAQTVIANVGAGFQNMEVLTTVGTGTWTLPAALLKIGAKFKVTAVGAGGAGADDGNAGDRGAGGGSGSVVIGFYTVSNTQNTTMSYGVGDRGTSSPTVNGGPSNTTYNATTFSAGGGASAINNTVTGGAGGTASGGTLNLNGYNGQSGTVDVTSTNPAFGKGADTPLGFGQGGDIPIVDSVSSPNASGYGAGGAGGLAASSAQQGGLGAQGIIIIEY